MAHVDRRQSSDRGTYQAVATSVLLAVTNVLLLAGFAGPSDYFVLPNRSGWLYFAAVLVLAAAAIALLHSVDPNRKRKRLRRSRAGGVINKGGAEKVQG